MIRPPRPALLAFALLTLSCATKHSAAPVVASGARPEAPSLRLPEGVRPLRYDLDLAIVPSEEGYRGSVGIDLAVAKPTNVVWLNATDLQVSEGRFTINGAERRATVVPGGEDFVGFQLGDALPVGNARLVVSFSGKLDREHSRGLYRQNEGPGADDWYAYTFFEPIDARRAFPCFDEPNYKVPWRLSFHVKQSHVALANAPVASEAPEPNGMKKVVMAESKPLPSYLVAFVVGPFDLVDAGKIGRAATPLRFIVPRGRGGETAYATRTTGKFISLLEDYFDMDYPYVKLDVAVVPRYWGTMEHPGIVALGQPLTLIKPSEETLSRQQQYANIAIHELGHYWFGDYVTMKWWDDTWLNEALTSWLDAKITDQFEPAWHFERTRVGRAAGAMQADALPSAQQVRNPVTSKHEIANAFDADITYFKGSSVLRMFEAWMGEDKFRAMLRRYMHDHAWGNTSIDDFVAAIESAGPSELGAAFRSFIEQPGLPLVNAELLCDKAAPRLGLSQQRFFSTGLKESDQLWQIPVCVKWGNGNQSGRTCTLLRERSAEVTIEGAKRCPAWMMPNEKGIGYYLSAITPALLHPFINGSWGKLELAEKGALLRDVRELVNAGQLQLGDALALLPLANHDSDLGIVRASTSLLELIRRDLLQEKARARFAHAVRTLYGPRLRTLGWRAKPGEPVEATELRPRILSLLGIVGDDPAVIKEAHRLALAWLGDRAALDGDLVPTVLRVAARSDDRELFDRYLGEAKRIGDRREREMLLSALTAFRDPTLLQKALALVSATDLDIRETSWILVNGMYNFDSRPLTYDYLKQSFDALTRRMRSDELLIVLGSLGTFCDDAHRADIESFFGERVKKQEGAPRALARALEEVRVCSAAARRNAPSVEAFLKRY